MMSVLRRFEAFLFTRTIATGFGAMRVAWALTALLFFLLQWGDVQTFYGPYGFLPSDYEPLLVRDIWRFTLLDIFWDASSVQGLYLLLITSLTLSVLGIFPRAATIISFILLCSFHERNPFVLGGGDTVLRLVGFILCIAPSIDAFSIKRLKMQWAHWKQSKTVLSSPTQPLWPYRMLLWQIIVIYLSSFWFKMLGTMWWNGTAVSATLQQELFVRWSPEIMHLFLPLSPLITWFTLLFEGAWVLLLYPRSLSRWLFHWEPQPLFKRILIITGVLFHGGIFLLMDVGSFSVAMIAAYLGLLTGEDLEAMKKWLNKQWMKSQRKKLITNRQLLIAILYDAHCGLCLRSIFALQLFDWLKRLNYVDFRNQSERLKVAPSLTEETLDRAMHIVLPDGTTLNGFDAFRRLAWHLPPLWAAAPFLYLPGVPTIGRKIYANIAASRKKCSHEGCGLS